MQAPPQAWVGKTLLKPGDPVTIHRVDIYGQLGRANHPPVNTSVDGELPSSPVDGKTAYVVNYLGWETDGGESSMTHGNWEDPKTPEAVFARAADHASAVDEVMLTHYYVLLVPNFGTFEFCDYELEGYGD